MCTGLHIVCLHVKFMPLILALLVGSWKNTYYLCDQVCGGVTELSWLGLSTFLFLVCSVICYAFCHLFVLLVGFCGGTCLLSHNSKLCKNIITITHLYKPYLLRNESNDSESYFCSIALTCSEVFIYKTKWIHKLQTWKKYGLSPLLHVLACQVYFMPVHVLSTCTCHQEVKIALHSLWYLLSTCSRDGHLWYQRLCNAILTSWWWAHVLETCRGMK